MDNDHGEKMGSLGIVQKNDFCFILSILNLFSTSFQRYVIMGQDYFFLFPFFFCSLGPLKQSCLIYFENQKYLKSTFLQLDHLIYDEGI